MISEEYTDQDLFDEIEELLTIRMLYHQTLSLSTIHVDRWKENHEKQATIYQKCLDLIVKCRADKSDILS